VDSWYVMLFPGGVPESFRATASLLQQYVGGSLVARPHVTIAYLEGNVRPEILVERLEALSNPVVPIHGKGLFSFWPDSQHELFGYTLFMHVEKTEALERLHSMAVRAIAGTGIRPARSWEDTNLHVRLLDHLPLSPSRALRKLPEDGWAISFPATRLVLSQSAADGSYTEWLDMPLMSD